MKFLATNINTNSELPNNFLDMERITNTKFFEPQVGDMSIFERNEAYLLNQIPVEVNPANNLERFKAKIRENVANQNEPIPQSTEQKQKISENENITEIINNKYTPLVLLGAATLIGIYFYTKNKKG
jgi:hypothetical protein